MRDASLRRVDDLETTVLVDSTVFVGGVGATLQAFARDASKEPRVLLLHVGDAGREPQRRRGGIRSFLVTDADIRVALPLAAPGTAVAVPLARVATTPLAPLTELAETTHVRASRALLASITGDLASGSDTPPRTIDDALASLVQGIVLEHPRAASPDSREAALDIRLEALIDVRHTDPRVDVVQLARELHTSRRQLYRHAPNGAVAGLLTERRLATAAELLLERPDLRIADIAARSGFTSASRLRAQFLRRMGVTPTEYRRRASEPDQS